MNKFPVVRVPAFKVSRPVFLAISLVFLWVLPHAARADDKVERLIASLQSSPEYKVRLSAALNLAKLRDKRSIPAFIRALSDSDRTVRGVAAAALGKIVDGEVSKERREQVLSALKRTATKDDNDFVRKQAQKAYDTVAAIDGGSGDEGVEGGGKVFVDIGAMSDKSGEGGALRDLMRKTTLNTFKKNAGDMRVEWPGKPPTKSQLSSKGFMGFHVDGTLTELSAQRGGGSTQVSCKVSMLLATYPEKSMFGFLNGGASVQTGKSDRDVAFAKEDCVAAVMEDLIARKIIPTIQSRTR